MVRRWLFSLCLVMLLSGLAAAQTKTVTNADLEKFRQKRVAGEKGLKAYYARQGMTEEDVAKKEAADAKAREELSARLRSERLSAGVRSRAGYTRRAFGEMGEACC